MRRELILLLLCCCSALALAAGSLWFVDLRQADAGSVIFTVDNTFDDSDANLGDGECETAFIDCTLRAAIEQANFSGADTIQFNIPGAGPHIISLGSAYPALTDSVTIDGTTEPSYVGPDPVVVLDGVFAGAGANGLVLNAGSSTVRALNIQRFDGYGISLNSFGSNVIEGNYIGTDETGALDRGNGDGGIRVNVGGNQIGVAGSTRNVISGNDANGIDILTGSSTVVNNYIGLTAAGTAARANTGNGISVLTGGNVIGGSNAASRNVISANTGNGLLIIGESADANSITGNYIGLTADGATALGNGFTGVGIVNGADSNTVGGSAATPGSPPGNVISSNGTNGIGIGAGGTATDNDVLGNLIGTDATGTFDRGNASDGIALFSDAASTTIGGSASTDRNVISGNNDAGVSVTGGTPASHVIAGNYIGTNAAGTGSIPNVDGIVISESSGNTIGGTTGTPGVAPGNLISGNSFSGIIIDGEAADGNSILGNLIGTNATGTLDLGNLDIGVFIIDGADNTAVGSELSGSRNVISGNDVRGVGIFGTGTTGNLVQGNYIGTNITGTGAIANTQGVTIADLGPSGNTIGGTTAAARNIISGNTQDGVRIGETTSATGNFVTGNYIGLAADGATDLGNGTDGVIIISGSTNNVIGGTTAGARNIISGNGQSGVAIGGAGVTGNQVIGNYIGTNAAGTSDVGNTDYGVGIDGAPANVIGGTIPEARNIISGNDITGVGIGAATGSVAGTVVAGNYIGTNAAGTSGIGNTYSGVGFGYGATDVTVGGSEAAAGNLIAFNGLGGVDLGPDAFPGVVSDITIRGNSIHSNATLGIDIDADGAVEPNDAGDVDTGDNGIQNFPALTSAETGSAIIKGTFNSTPSSIFVLDFYASPSCDGSGNGEGQTYLGASAVVTDGSGNAAFEVAFDAPLAVGQAVTATATDTAGSTSEFSACSTAAALTLTPLIGTGTAGDCGPGPTPVGSCAINLPRGLHEVVGPAGVSAGQGEAASGLAPALYFAEGAPNNKIKKLEPADSTGAASDVAGGGGSYCNNCNALTTSLDGPRDVFVYGKAAYVADTNNCIVRRIDLTSNMITTVAGQNDVCSSDSTALNGDNGSATSATLNQPRGVAVDAAGNLYLADTLNHRIRMVAPEPAGDGIVDGDPGEIITTIAGTGTPSASSTGANGDTGLATAATFNEPHDVYFLAEDLIVADTNNNKIRRIDYPAGTITTIAGTGVFDYTGDGGPATAATLKRPEAVTTANSKVVIADSKNNAIRMVDLIGRLGDPATPPAFPAVAPGTITTVAPGTTLNNPTGVFVVSGPTSADGALRVSNTDDNRIVTSGIDPTGTHTTNIRPSVSCGNVPGVSGVDWLIPVMMLGAIAARRRIGTLFSRLYALATRRASSPATA